MTGGEINVKTISNQIRLQWNGNQKMLALTFILPLFWFEILHTKMSTFWKSFYNALAFGELNFSSFLIFFKNNIIPRLGNVASIQIITNT
jgi:hypothetical protein